MSEGADLTEFVAAYLVETEEHLGVANSQLLAIEASLRKGESNPRALRETFRALHTIKGLSSMVGVEPVVEIAHRMETFLRDFDREGSPLPTRAVDVLLRGVRAIGQRIASLGSGTAVAPPPQELITEFDTLGAPLPQDQKPLLDLDLEPELLAKLAPFELAQLRTASEKACRALRVDFLPSPARAAEGFTINSVRERLAGLGEVVKALPLAVPVSTEAPGGLAFALLLVSDAADDVIAQAVGIAPNAVKSLLARSLAVGVDPSERALPPELVEDERPGPRQAVVRVDVRRLDDAMERLSALIVTRFRLARAIAELGADGADTRAIQQVMSDSARELRDLRAAIVAVRMVPVAELLERIPLLVRGLCRHTERAVKLELEAGNAELDKAVSERLFPVIVHLVRNAVDHAIESPDERVRRGKPREGLLRVSCSSRSNTRLELSISDDGRGIDREAVARKAGRPTPASDQALLDLLCIPGLSTRSTVTTTSGRGMGMEIVKRIVIDDLGGELELVSTFGVGTRFLLRVPLTISIVDAFSFECEGQRFVVPVSTVEEIVEIDAALVSYSPMPRGDQPRVGIIARRGKAIPLLMLSELFQLGPPRSVTAKAIVVRRAGQPLAFGVDRMLGQQEVVIRPIDDALIRSPGVTGATDLGDGKPTLVLDLSQIGAAYAALEVAAAE